MTTGKTKGKIIKGAVVGFLLGVVVAPLLPFMLAYELATEDWWE